MMNKLIRILLLASMMAALLTIRASAQLSLTPDADTWVDLNQADMSFDGYALLADYSSFGPFEPTRRTFLRFDLSSLTYDVGAGVTLSLYVTSAPLTTSGTLALWSADDDWNGGDSGLGDGGDLTWNSSLALIGSSLDTQSADTTSGATWVVFASSDLRDFINSQRAANGGSDYASFMIEWQSCSTCDFFGDSIEFEDDDNYRGTGNPPRLGLVPTGVTLSSFTAKAETKRLVMVQWETASEVDTLGFNLYRAESVDGMRTRINEELIRAQKPGSPMGARYEFVDEELEFGTAYYWLEIVDVRGRTEVHGPVSAVAGGYRLYLPLTVRH